MSMRKRWPLMSIGDLFVVASTQNEEEASSPQVRQLIWFLIAQWRWWWWGWLKHPLHQSCWPNSKQTNHPLGGRYQPITREHSQMTSQSASVPFLPKLSFFFSFRVDAPTLLPSICLFWQMHWLVWQKEKQIGLTWTWNFENGSYCASILILPPSEYYFQEMQKIYSGTYASIASTTY